ncbi:MAG: type II toxin-antitoxin system ParD family antitoxin [Gammaproteobacteria bacterium]|nr:type II toxin-antitoxin system ParD family antitoxin [Gammaproteobacteria bacterium]
MIRHTISIPERMSEYLLHQVNSGQYGNISEYFRDLIRQDQQKTQSDIDKLRGLLEKAEASGVSQLSLDDIKNNARKLE